MISINISADTPEEAFEEGLRQLGVSRDAVTMDLLSSAHDDTLPGAEPLPGVTVRLVLKEEVIVSQAKEHLKKMLELIGVEAQIEVLRRRGGVVLNIHAGGDDSLIIGRNGQNLEAFQIIVNRMVIHGGRDLFPLFVDCENYLEKRLERLERIASRSARNSLREGREIALEPMSAFERKIIHNALKETRGIHTISRGEGLERHIVICPDENVSSVLERRRLKPHRRPYNPSKPGEEHSENED